MDRKVKLLVGGVGIAVLLAILVTTTMGSAAEFVTPTELAETDDYDEEYVQLEGRAIDLADDDQITFDVLDENHTVPVGYDGEMPETMSEGRIVVAEGHYTDGEVVADDLTVRAHEGEHPGDNESIAEEHEIDYEEYPAYDEKETDEYPAEDGPDAATDEDGSDAAALPS